MPTEPIVERIRIAAPASAVFALYADVRNWHRWDPDTRAAALDGALQVGTHGWLKPRKGLRVRMRVTQVEPGRSLTVECPVLGNRMRFEHEIAPQGGGVLVTHRVSFHGWAAGWLDRTVGRDVRAGLPRTLDALRRHAEQGPAGPATMEA